MVPLLSVPDRTVTSLEEQANLFGQHFASVCDSFNYSPVFQKLKTKPKKQTIGCPLPRRRNTISPSHFAGQCFALSSTTSTAPGLGYVHYSMLTQLSSDSVLVLLNFFNRIWRNGRLPKRWKHAITVPFLKAGKDRSHASSYRPTALASCPSNTFERLVNRGLVHLLEQLKVLDPLQCGFRRLRSTQDHLVRFKADIRESFLCKQFHVSGQGL